MASIVERRGRFCVVYSYKDKNGKRRQKWETYKTMSEAKKRKKEIEYRADIGQMIVPHCKTVKELLEESVNLYGKEAWAVNLYGKEAWALTSHRYGEITGKYVIYRGESGSLEGIQYLNVEEYLKSL